MGGDREYPYEEMLRRKIVTLEGVNQALAHSLERSESSKKHLELSGDVAMSLLKQAYDHLHNCGECWDCFEDEMPHWECAVEMLLEGK